MKVVDKKEFTTASKISEIVLPDSLFVPGREGGNEMATTSAQMCSVRCGMGMGPPMACNSTNSCYPQNPY